MSPTAHRIAWLPAAAISLACAVLAMQPHANAEETSTKLGKCECLLKVFNSEDVKNQSISPAILERQKEAIANLKIILPHLPGKNPEVTAQDNGDIRLYLSDVSESSVETIRHLLAIRGELSFHEVSPRNDEVLPDGKTLVQAIFDGEEKVPGYSVMQEIRTNEEGDETQTPVLIKTEVALDSSTIKTASPSLRQSDAIDIALNDIGAEKMTAFTKDMTPSQSRIAVVLDGKVISAPVLSQVPLGRRFILEGFHNPGEPTILAHYLNTRPEPHFEVRSAKFIPSNSESPAINH